MNTRRLLLHAAVLLAPVLAIATPPSAHAAGPWTPDDTLAALADAGPVARCIVRLEVGGVGYDPYAIGRAGEMGVAQLHPRGLYPLFVEQGYTDVFSPYQSVAFLEWALDHGLGPNWSTYGRCA